MVTDRLDVEFTIDWNGGRQEGPRRRRKPANALKGNPSANVDEMMLSGQGAEDRTEGLSAVGCDGEHAGGSNSERRKLLVQLADYEAHLNAAQQRIMRLVEEIEGTEHEADLRETQIQDRDSEILRLKRRLLEAETRPSPSKMSDAKFIAAKRAFAKLYHPNNSSIAGLERMIREAIFKEFWIVLEDIEREEGGQ